jgi:hypothetical protein
MELSHFNVSGESPQQLKALLEIVFGPRRRAIAYTVRDATPGERWPAEKYLKDPRDANLLEWYRKPKPTRMVFYWADFDTVKDRLSLPFKLDAAGAADFASRWLAEVEYPNEPDHDGSNAKGWHAYCEGWGHVDDEHSAFLAIAPRWSMHGK